MAKILVVEDETDLAELVKNWLAKDHHLVESVSNGLDALIRMETNKYDVVLLDMMLPTLDGLEILKRYRKAGGSAGVIMLTARAHVDDKELGLDAGADDYLTKPFQLKELAARVRAVLRRNHVPTQDVLKFRDLVIDPQEFKVLKGESDVHLLPKEFRLLEFFVRHPHQVFSAEDLLSSVWESDTEALLDTVRGHITRLRKKLDSPGEASIIATVYGVGYKLGDG
ncbi:MAG: response regulator transcription factor [Candidatus Obscuribacter sp.]|nr:response regulator transcription factor [Candidatus Obscuribacter sp.]MBK9619802.1 response regulator transcription factor [Candidatus Obscuribacter sp.]MBP6352103.1 response regulator transcription factor [Candidatus Obscuribacter sp.]MBP7577664.1 response regulator transcription factor [Candidatus Obscuribacter sp.]MDQ5963935.1 Response regulator transcription factor [Cyanobacteriota bacterium erpe_2018_sw_39hr_WHONDRS-SW48-000098_B_bin.30]